MKLENGLIFFDLDDCLIEWNLWNILLQTNDIIFELENTTREEVFIKSFRSNLKIIKNIALKYNLKLFMISDWVYEIELKEDKLIYKFDDKLHKMLIEVLIEEIFDILVGLREKHSKREEVIKKIAKNNPNKKFIVLDDIDFTKDFKNFDNITFIHLINGMIYKNRQIDNIFNLEKYINFN